MYNGDLLTRLRDLMVLRRPWVVAMVHTKKISFHTCRVKSGNFGHQVNSDSDLAYFIF